MWSLGCVMAELFLGWPLYPGDSEFDQVCYICETQGLPEARLLNVASKAHHFFERTDDRRRASHWQLRSHKRRPPVSAEGLVQGKGSTERRKYILASLDQLETVEFTELDPELRNQDMAAEVVDRHSMVQLIKRMLTLDSHQRIVPAAASQHPFISMVHLRIHPDCGRYYDKSARAVRSALIQDAAPENDCFGSSQPNAAGARRSLCASEDSLQRCPRGRRHRERITGHSTSLGGFQENSGALTLQSPVPDQSDSSTEQIEDLLEGLGISEEASLEASLEAIAGCGAEDDARRGSSSSSSVEPTDPLANLHCSKSNANPEIRASTEDPEIGSLLSYFTRPCQNQRLRQPVARSSKSDPTVGLSCTSGPQVRNADEPKGSSPFYGNSIIQPDLTGSKKQNQDEQAACHYERRYSTSTWNLKELRVTVVSGGQHGPPIRKWPTVATPPQPAVAIRQSRVAPLLMGGGPAG
ncbi:hypothetical protein DPEC_G00299160 [Dallia pectoralis]|uniref:Uncharacterized protein n=1 Tax=Dallia pectoralis TaxID=75939 RepID=A0ACC2FG50_DALPE|nr:hypothetical protein DPEC_G00299160 [Dallia pectoralis]